MENKKNKMLNDKLSLGQQLSGLQVIYIYIYIGEFPFLFLFIYSVVLSSLMMIRLESEHEIERYSKLLTLVFKIGSD